MFDQQAVERSWPLVLSALAKISMSEYINQEEIDAVQTFLKEMSLLESFINENWSKQIYGRIYRKEGDKYILDPNGDYVSFRGMWGAVWYRPKSWSPVAGGSKHIAPFD